MCGGCTYLKTPEVLIASIDLSRETSVKEPIDASVRDRDVLETESAIKVFEKALGQLPQLRGNFIEYPSNVAEFFLDSPQFTFFRQYLWWQADCALATPEEP